MFSNCRLVEAFGSTRRKRQMKQREEGAVVVTRNADKDRLGLLLGEVAARATATGETRAEVRTHAVAAQSTFVRMTHRFVVGCCSHISFTTAPVQVRF
jgi:hypothetical protein